MVAKFIMIFFQAGSREFGNSVYRITLDEGVFENPPIFGGKYNFHLEVCPCPTEGQDF